MHVIIEIWDIFHQYVVLISYEMILSFNNLAKLNQYCKTSNHLILKGILFSFYVTTKAIEVHFDWYRKKVLIITHFASKRHVVAADLDKQNNSYVESRESHVNQRQMLNWPNMESKIVFREVFETLATFIHAYLNRVLQIVYNTRSLLRILMDYLWISNEKCLHQKAHRTSTRTTPKAGYDGTVRHRALRLP